MGSSLQGGGHYLLKEKQLLGLPGASKLAFGPGQVLELLQSGYEKPLPSPEAGKAFSGPRQDWLLLVAALT